MMLCRIIQWQIEKELDDHGRIHHPRILSHLEHCPACRDRLHQLKQIELHCRTAPDNVSDARLLQIESAVQHRLADELAYANPSANRPAAKSPRRRLALHAAAILMLVAGMFGLYTYLADNADKTAPPTTTPPLSQLDYQLPALNIVPEQLLENELQNMETDIYTTVRFIHDCLPKELLAANFTDESQDIIDIPEKTISP